MSDTQLQLLRQIRDGGLGGSPGGGDATAANQVLALDKAEEIRLVLADNDASYSIPVAQTAPASGAGFLLESVDTSRTGFVIFNASEITRLQLSLGTTDIAQVDNFAIASLAPRETYPVNEPSLASQAIMVKSETTGTAVPLIYRLKDTSGGS